MHMKHVKGVLSLYVVHEMTEVTEIPHVMEGCVINSSPEGKTEVRLNA